jgi:hypothetical protein
VTDLWYFSFVACVLVLLAFATPRDKNALRIILAASVVSEVLVVVITRQIHAPWKLVIPGAVEVLTIASMFRWSKNRTGHLQIGCLCAAWLAHFVCYIDVCLGTDLIYSHYETFIQVVAAAQIAACYDSMLAIGRRIADFARALRMAHLERVSSAGGIHPSLQQTGLSRVPKIR